MTKAASVMMDLARFLRSKEHYAEHRGYLGMSGIGNCPRQQYFNFVDPRPPDDRLSWYKWIGYTLEDAAIALLRLGGCEFVPDMSQHGLIADFDDRYRGHIDHVLSDNTLIEIKSVGWAKFVAIRDSNRPPKYNLDQCQAYMRHGQFSHTLLVYVCRDVPYRDWEISFSWRVEVSVEREFLSFWVVDVPRDEARMDMLDDKAKEMLIAIDAGEPPQCNCRWCGR